MWCPFAKRPKSDVHKPAITMLWPIICNPNFLNILYEHPPRSQLLKDLKTKVNRESQHTHFEDKIQDQISWWGFPKTCVVLELVTASWGLVPDCLMISICRESKGDSPMLNKIACFWNWLKSLTIRIFNWIRQGYPPPTQLLAQEGQERDWILKKYETNSINCSCYWIISDLRFLFLSVQIYWKLLGKSHYFITRSVGAPPEPNF